MSSLADRVPVNESNREARQALALLVDTSESMRNDLADVVAGLSTLREAIMADGIARNCVELALVTFGGTVSLHGEFGEITGFEVPQLVASGNTPMATALEQALDLVEAKKSAYKASGLRYHRPWIYLITDGEPTDPPPLWPQAVERVRAAEAQQKVALFTVGTASANFGRLKELSAERVPLQLRGNNWGAMFQWLSSSLQARSRSRPGEQAPLQDPTGPRGWASVA
jgi:uncharacterized protein YegL